MPVWWANRAAQRAAIAAHFSPAAIGVIKLPLEVEGIGGFDQNQAVRSHGPFAAAEALGKRRPDPLSAEPYGCRSG